MRRRTFIRMLGGAVATAPFAALGQQAIPTVGVASSASPKTSIFRKAFVPYMKQLGLDEGRDYRLSIVFSGGHEDRIAAVVNQLLDERVSVIVAPGSQHIEAAQRATTTIPIVGLAGDMVRQGFVASLAHPGGNITGVNLFTAETSAKRLELLHEAFPAAKRIGVLIYPEAQWRRPQLEAAASRLEMDLVVVTAGNDVEVDHGLDALESMHIDAVDVDTLSGLFAWRGLIAERLNRVVCPRSMDRQRQPLQMAGSSPMDHFRPLRPADRPTHRQDTAWRTATRPPRRRAGEARSRSKPQDRQGAGAHDPRLDPRPRR